MNILWRENNRGQGHHDWHIDQCPEWNGDFRSDLLANRKKEDKEQARDDDNDC